MQIHFDLAVGRHNEIIYRYNTCINHDTVIQNQVFLVRLVWPRLPSKIWNNSTHVILFMFICLSFPRYFVSVITIECLLFVFPTVCSYYYRCKTIQKWRRRTTIIVERRWLYFWEKCFLRCTHGYFALSPLVSSRKCALNFGNG